MADVIGRLIISLVGDNKELNKALDAAQKGIKGFNKNIDKISKSFVNVGKSATKYLTLPILGALAAISGVVGVSIKMAADLEESMRNVNTVMGVSEEQLSNFTDQILDMSKTLPQSAKNLAEGLYDIAGSGFAGADAMKVLDASARAASAGVTTTEIATKGVVAVLNAYGWGAEYAAFVSDAMFATVDKGVISFAELSGSIGDIVSTASVAGIKFNELSGFIAYLTIKGISGAEATTMLNRQIMSIISPSEKMAKLLKESGYESGELALKEIGLLGVMKLVNDETGGSITKMQELFPEVRAMKGASAELGAGYGTLTEFMKGFVDVSGTTDDALEEQSKGFKFQLQVLKNNFAAAGIEIGNKFLPALTDVVEQMKTKVIPALGDLADYLEPIIAKGVEFIPVLADLAVKYIPIMVDKIGEWVGWFMNLEPIWKKVILAAITFATVFGPIMIVIGKLIPAFKLLLPVLKFLVTVIGWILHPAAAFASILKVLSLALAAIASPVGIAIAIITALIAIGVLVWKNWDVIKVKAIEIWGAISNFFVNLWETIKQSFQSAWEWLKNLFLNYTPYGLLIQHWEEIVLMFSNIWENVKNTFKNALQIIWKWMLDWIPFLNLIIENWGKIVEFFTVIWNKIKEIFINVFNVIRDFITNNFNIISQKVTTIWTSIKDFFITIWEGIKTAFTTALEFINNLISTVFNFLKDSIILPVWNSIVDFFRNIWDSIISQLILFKEAFLKIWDYIKEGLKIPINAMIRLINGLLSRIQSGINSMVSALNKIGFKIPDWLGKIIPGLSGKEFGINLKYISIPKIPELALGGIIKETGFVDVGERGRERIFLPKAAKVIPLEKTISSISNYFSISGLTIREEADIEKIANKLHELQIRAQRGMGYK